MWGPPARSSGLLIAERGDGILMTRPRHGETLDISVVGKCLFHHLAAPGSPYRHAALGRPAPLPSADSHLEVPRALGPGTSRCNHFLLPRFLEDRGNAA